MVWHGHGVCRVVCRVQVEWSVECEVVCEVLWAIRPWLICQKELLHQRMEGIDRGHD